MKKVGLPRNIYRAYSTGKQLKGKVVGRTRKCVDIFINGPAYVVVDEQCL